MLTATQPVQTKAVDTHTRIAELDGLRAIAVLLVLLCHFWPTEGVWRAASSFAEFGWVGVDIFFVLSGFLITGILMNSRDSVNYYRHFYVRRAFRIFPIYYAFLIGAVLFMAFWHGGAYWKLMQVRWGSPVWFFCYLGNFISSMGALPPLAIFVPLWSLQIEEQFYVVFPWCVRRFGKRLPQLLIGVVVAAVCWRFFTAFAFPTHRMFQYTDTLCRADALAVGGLTRILVQRSRSSRVMQKIARCAPTGLLLLIGIYSIIGTDHDHVFTRTIGFSLNAFVFAACLVWILCHQGTARTKFLRSAPMQFLGKISYGVYILQLAVQSATKIVSGQGLGSPIRTPIESLVWIGLTIVVAWLSWRYFERPMLTWGSRFAGDREVPGVSVFS